MLQRFLRCRCGVWMGLGLGGWVGGWVDWMCGLGGAAGFAGLIAAATRRHAPAGSSIPSQCCLCAHARRSQQLAAVPRSLWQQVAPFFLSFLLLTHLLVASFSASHPSFPSLRHFTHPTPSIPSSLHHIPFTPPHSPSSPSRLPGVVLVIDPEHTNPLKYPMSESEVVSAESVEKVTFFSPFFFSRISSHLQRFGVRFVDSFIHVFCWSLPPPHPAVPLSRCVSISSPMPAASCGVTSCLSRLLSTVRVRSSSPWETPSTRWCIPPTHP